MARSGKYDAIKKKIHTLKMNGNGRKRIDNKQGTESLNRDAGKRIK